ncbi:M14 family metallocarboxypeptidase [Shewanella yunxiaonensis]|uniref:M14 family metallocarboxypeptidase n=1 Tax=Shewanella yunxiaonensis TaxID=2829809 RepID=A0ABX7YWJ8_9GAMM|nr:M14 family metallocarboxypeptidase [Shewanella yunxiaonensis]QUN07170.1 M14 family metallocarboxypeptidase [Shewanella yunxiaonensis]
MDQSSTYPIGTPGVPWGDSEKTQWRQSRAIQRSYQAEVLDKISALAATFDIIQYGALSYDTKRYPLLALKSKNWDAAKPGVLITGGVHGYETSGVQGALLFAQSQAQLFTNDFNLLIAPCVSPWGYEVINRWNPLAIDPNRSFYVNSPAEESASLMALVAEQPCEFLAHIDLHETTDTDESEFRPALSARDGKAYQPGEIPDGFYVVDDSAHPQPAFQKAIIAAVAKVTHIAPADKDGNIIGSKVVQPGVIEYALKELGLCASVTGAPYTCTTEVYPDSPNATDDICNQAQVAAVCGALKFLLQNG